METFSGFLFAAFILCLSPGPDNLFVLSQSTLYGINKGVSVTLGLCTGLLIHTTLVAAGIAALLLASPIALSLLKLVGISYLLYLAWQSFWASSEPTSNTKDPRFSNMALYRRGIVMNITNPKVSLFFLAFLPQFVNQQQGEVSTQIFILGLLFIATTLCVFISIAVVAGKLGGAMQYSRKTRSVLNKLVALIFLVLAIRLGMDAGNIAMS